MITTPWPGLALYARDAGEIHPYDPANADRFRGEEAFAPEVSGWRRWSKPSPEPQLDHDFKRLLLASIELHRETVGTLVNRVGQGIAALTPEPPVLVAILRAGVPVAHLLASWLSRWYAQPVPCVAISLFQGLGWDAEALQAVIDRHPGRAIWFVDGWTSRGGVATELGHAYRRWLEAGRPDFTGGNGPRLAVLCDPGGFATIRGVASDCFIPSACFTAPETLGFSRGFAEAGGGLLSVYTFPPDLVIPEYLAAWDGLTTQPPGELNVPSLEAREPVPSGWRLHINEVVRALINRQPREVRFSAKGEEVAACYAPVLHLARVRGVPMRFDCPEVAAWGAIAAARMEQA